VLIVDDIAMNRFALREVLKRQFGLRSIEATNGKECIEIMKEQHKKKVCCSGLKIVFMDLEMPEMDGLQVIFSGKMFRLRRN